MKKVKNIETYLDEHAKTIIDAVVAEKGKPTFDTHAFILKLLQDALGIQAGMDTFVQTLDSQIGKCLSQMAEEKKLPIQKTKEVHSLNLKGTISENQEWEKL